MEVKLNKLTSLIEILGKTGTLKILELLEVSPRRYNELKRTCSSDRTLAQRLRELEKCDLVETVSQKTEGRFFVHYKMTEKGKNIFSKVKEIR